MAGAWLTGSGAEGGADRSRAVLVAVRRDDAAASGLGSELSLTELRRLAETDGLAVVDAVVQNRASPDPNTYIGSGKVDELTDAAVQTGAELVIADGDLSPAQVRNLEDQVGVRVVDRSALILDVFAAHAHTSEGRLQVELAQIEYQLSRVGGDGRAMSRIGGGRVAGGAGIGVRGPGEQRLETNRRRLRQRASRLRERAAQLERRRETTSRRRARNRVPGVALTGYTNAGKSALLNRLTGADVLVQDVLFATLDPTIRRLWLDGVNATVADTVGFVRYLPHQLIDAFRSTLAEVRRADLLLHVVDATAPDAFNQIDTVHSVLAEIGAGGIPEMLLLNKIDVAPPDGLADLRSAHPDAVPISALTGAGLDDLRAALAARLRAAPAGPPSPA
jgi:GTP-binding protein HflX